MFVHQHGPHSVWAPALLALIVAFSLLVACTPPAAPAAEQPAAAPVEISLWTEFTAGGEATGIEELVKT